MAETYDIMCDASQVGTAQVEKQGLYYRFSCRCRLPDEGIYRIHVCCGDKRADLGICVPLDGFFGMDKKIPVKYFADGEMVFWLLPRDWKEQEISLAEESEPAEEAEQMLPEEKPVEEETAEPGSTEGSFIPISEEEPFAHLDKLENAVLEVREEQIGIVLQKQE